MQAHTTKGVDTGRNKDHGCLYSLLCLLRGNPPLEFFVSFPSKFFNLCMCTYIHAHTWYYFVSFQFSGSVMSDSLQPHGLQHTRPHCPSPTPEVYSNSCPLSRWCHPTISSSVILLFDFKWIASYILKNLCNLSVKYKENNTFVPTTQRKKWNFTHTFKASHVYLPPN